MRFPTLTIATAIVFILTYAGIALGRIPGFRLDRAGIALTGAALMMAIGAIKPEEAYRAVNLETLALLLGMMIVVAHLRLSGFFRLVTSWALVRAHSPLILLVTVAVTAGAFSTFLVNDAVCLVMAPLVIEVTRSLRRTPPSLSPGCGDGVECRQCGHDHRESAKHDRRRSFAHPLRGICRRLGTARGSWTGCCHCRACNIVVGRVPIGGRTYGQSAACAGAQGPARQSGSGDARRDRRLLRRRAGGDGRLSRRRLVAGDPRDQGAQGLSGDRRFALVDVRRSLCRGCGSGENPVDARRDRIGAGLSLREYLCSHIRHRGAFQRHQQCAGGISAQAVRARPS